MTRDLYDDEPDAARQDQIRVWYRHTDEDGEITTISRRADTAQVKKEYL